MATRRARDRRPRAAGRDGAKDRLAEQAADVTDQIRNGVRAVKDETARRVGTLGRMARDEAARLVDAQKARAAARVRAVGGSVDKAARLLRAVRGDALADYVDAAAGAAERTADYIEKSDLADVADDAADLMRRHPLLTAGTLLVAGVIAGRLLSLAAADEREGESAEGEAEDDEVDEKDEADDDDGDDDEDEDEE